jgi:hypothetical protein
VIHFQTCATVGSLLLLLINAPLRADESRQQQKYQARDSLAPPKDESADAQACLDELTWTPGEFQVRCDSSLMIEGAPMSLSNRSTDVS